MASELIAGLSLFKTLMDMAKGLKDINDATIRNAAVIELQEKILTAREQQTAALERISDLEKEVARFEAWGTEKQRYQLTDYGGGTFAYALKEETSAGEPSHRICAACYQNGHKSILQSLGRFQDGREKATCPACQTGFKFGNYNQPTWPTTVRRPSGQHP